MSCARGFEQIDPGRITTVDAEIEAPNRVDLLRIVIEHSGFDATCEHRRTLRAARARWHPKESAPLAGGAPILLDAACIRLDITLTPSNAPAIHDPSRHFDRPHGRCHGSCSVRAAEAAEEAYHHV